MAEQRRPLPPLRPRFSEPPHPDEGPEVWACACGEPIYDPRALTCPKCTDRAHQRDAEPCVFCGRDSHRSDGVCERCAQDERLFRSWSEGDGRR